MEGVLSEVEELESRRNPLRAGRAHETVQLDD